MGERVGVGQPGTRTGPELKLAGPAPSRQTIGEGVQQRATGAIGVDQVGVEADSHPSGEVVGTVAQPADRAAVGLIVDIASGEDPQPQREVGGEVVGAPAQHVALVDQHRQGTAERGRLGHQHACQAGVHREPEHLATDLGDPVVGVDRFQVVEQFRGSLQRLAGRWSRKRQLLGRGAPGGEFEHQARQVDLLDLAVTRWAARVPCSILLHNR